MAMSYKRRHPFTLFIFSSENINRSLFYAVYMCKYVDFPQQNAIYSSTGKALTDMTHVCIHEELPNE